MISALTILLLGKRRKKKKLHTAEDFCRKKETQLFAILLRCRVGW